MASTDERPPGIDRVPTLTEVVELGPAFGTSMSPPDMPELGGLLLADGPTWAGDALLPLPDDGPTPPVDAATLATQVLQELAPRIDLLFEACLRDALAPALARAADGLVRDAREEVAAALRALVEQAVASALEQRNAG